MNKNITGILLVLGTAVISGFSVFINKYGVKETNPYVFTFIKNLIASLPFLFLTIPVLKEIKKLDLKNKLLLFSISIIGGSIPFLLFFKGLSLASATNASFIHKTMFLYIALIGTYYLKEKINWLSILGIITLLIGSLLFFKINPSKIGIGEFYVLLATLLWVSEILISKKLLADISANLIIFSRMFVGAIFIFCYLAVTKQTPLLLQLNAHQWTWILIGGTLLSGYVFTFYHGLKHISATESTAILTLAVPITSILTLIVQGKHLLPNQTIAIPVLLTGILIIIFSKATTLTLLKRTLVSFSPQSDTRGKLQRESRHY